MLTTNVDNSDRLINGQLGPVYDFPTNIATVTKIYIKFDDNTAGLKTIQNTSLARTNNYVLISRTEAFISIVKNPYIYNQTNSISYYAGICLHHA